MNFDDDLFAGMRDAANDGNNTVGAANSMLDGDEGQDAAEEEVMTEDAVIDPDADDVPHTAKATPEVGAGQSGDGYGVQSNSSSGRRRRGTRVSGSSHHGSQRGMGQTGQTKRWRSGQIPPVFEGDIEADPYCLRHYRRRLMRWVMITKEHLPANEQALRAREQLKGEAELELEETPDSRYDDPDGINRLLTDLEQSFGERELFRQGGVIREFESVSRLQGESATQFVRRFRLLERKLQDNRVPEYPEEARVIKLLAGLRLDERSTSALLLAAGNRYNMKLIQEAIRIQRPPGMSVTGIRKGASTVNKRQRGNHRWSALSTHWEHDWEDEAGWEWDENQDEYDWTDWNNDNGEDYGAYATVGDDVVYEYEDSYAGSTDVPPGSDQQSVSGGAETTASMSAGSDGMVPQLMQAMNALTVTSQRLAQITQSRGFYHPKGDAKSKGKGKSGSKGEGSLSGGKSSGKSKGHGKKGGKSKGGMGKHGGKGKPGITPTRANFEHQQQLKMQRVWVVVVLITGSKTAPRWVDIQHLMPSWAGERCSFSFGPNKGVPSRERMQYPAGLGGVFVALGVIVVDSNAPALFSRPSFASLGAVPNIVQGVMHYEALKTESKLYLSPCGHLAIRIDEWPSHSFTWPIRSPDDSSMIEDACADNAVMLEPVPLVQSSIPSRPPPHASVSGAAFDGVCPHDSFGSALLRLHGSSSTSQGRRADAVLSSSDGHYHVDVNVGSAASDNEPNGQVPQRPKSVQTSFWPSFLWGSRSEHQHLPPMRVSLDERIRERSGLHSCNTEGITNRSDASVSKRVGSGKDCAGSDGKATSFKPKLRKLSKGFRWLFPTLFAATWNTEPRSENTHDVIAAQSETITSIPRCPYSLKPVRKLRTWRPRRRLGVRSRQMGPQDWYNRPGDFAEGVSQGHHSQEEEEQVDWLELKDTVSTKAFSADYPTQKEDVGSFKSGAQKRLLGNLKQLKSLWNAAAEVKIYESRCRSARQLRGYQHDIVEVFAGMANITAEAVSRGLSAIQPIDMVQGVQLESKEDFSVLPGLLSERKPFLVVWEIRCDPWSSIQHLNYTKEELEQIQESQCVSIKGMCEAILFSKDRFNIHFPAGKSVGHSILATPGNPKGHTTARCQVVTGIYV